MTEPTCCSRRRLDGAQVERDSPGRTPVSPGVRAYRPPRGAVAAGGPKTTDGSQAMSVYASRRQSCTARSGTRKERPTRTAESSPAWTRRDTVILETRIIAATSATVRNVTAARGAGTTGRPTGIAAGWAAGTGRAMVAAIGRPMGRGPGTPGRAMAGAAERWGMVMSSSPDLARVVAPASPPATEHARAATERKGTHGAGAMDESNRRTDPSWADVHICRRIDTSFGASSRHEHFR